ncbi:hypothetical protein KP509_02G102100 [Ceratopteris richardii]|uniref:DUF7963 domain-containing protein n=1 Tax=Ceratopteris richardii TaxID=49495 RepID=A0A8T2VCD1_CERRI|nr:hypothetical protein KP509_02G102100 [Ceratopteris richardii]
MAAHEDELSSKTLQKRYEGLVTVRSKAIKGKGAWYWVHLEPILVQNQTTGTIKAVKLRCGLCAALFSASNPSRTAAEHLKRGTCPNFNGIIPKPLACAPPFPSAGLSPRNLQAAGSTGFRKRHVPALSMPPTSAEEIMFRGANGISPLMLSGGKEDLSALALLEQNVKKLRSPCGGGTTCQGLSKGQIESALNLLSEWLYESCGTVSLSSVEHPKFKAFLNFIGLPPISRRYLVGPKLDSKYEEIRVESEARLRDAMFFQLASDGWWNRRTIVGESLINVTLNLPNGTSLFHKIIALKMPSQSEKLIEDTLWESVVSVAGSALERCVGIVADADKQTLKALQELEIKNRWMINLSCQVRALSNLMKSLYKHHELFRSLDIECKKVASLFANKQSAWSYVQKLQGDAIDGVKLLRSFPPSFRSPEPSEFLYSMAVAEDIASCARFLQMASMDESFKMAHSDSPLGNEVVELLSGVQFWSDLEAALSLIKLVKLTVQEVEMERPSVSYCLPLWVNFRAKVKDWCMRYDRDETHVDQLIEKQFSKSYHPAWSAAFILDPLFLIRDTSGKYLPPFSCLTSEQEKDVDRLITRLVPSEEAHIAVMELLKWRANGLDPLYAQAVQIKEKDPVTGKMKPVTPQSRRIVWETCLSEFKVLGKVAVRLISLHSCASSLKCNRSIWKWVYRNGNTRVAAERAQKMIYIASHSRLNNRNDGADEDRDCDLFSFDEDDDTPDESSLWHLA